MRSEKHVLVAGLDPVTEEKIHPALSRPEFDVSRVPALHSADELLRVIPFDVLILDCPDPVAPLRSLLETLRAEGSPSRQANVLLISPAARLPEAETLLALGASQALSADLGALELQEAVLSFLRARVRVDTRVMARLTVRLGERSPQLLCQTRNLSRSGMLAVTDSRYPLATPVQFILELAQTGDTVLGEAEVVRHAARPRDPVEGIGLRFLQFTADGERRLVTFLEKQGA